jgi:hypothetical protein
MSLVLSRTHLPLLRKTKVVKAAKIKKASRPIKKVSSNRVKINREYAKLREQFLLHNPYCEWSLKELNKPVPAKEIHHKKGRGKYLLDTSTWMAVSSEGHRAIHADPKKSYAMGWMLPRR